MCEGMGGGPAAASGDAGEAFAGEAQQSNGQNGQGGFDAVLAELAGMAESHEQMRQQLAGLPQLQAQQGFDGDPSAFYDDLGADDGPGLDAGLDPGDPFDGESFDPEAAVRAEAQAIGGYVQSQTEPLREGLQSLQDAHENLQWQHDVSELVAEFPEMGQQETAVSVWGATARAAHAIGQPELASNVHLARMTYLAGRALEAAAQEPSGDEPPGAARLEGGGGAAGPGGGGLSPAQQILHGGGELGAGVLPFGH